MFFYYILSVWGLTHIIVSSKITEGLRNWFLIKYPKIGYLLDCYQCTSFWSSMILYGLFDLNIELYTINLYLFQLDIAFLIMGFIGSGLITFISVILSLLITLSKIGK